jgi:hypothetical protein
MRCEHCGHEQESGRFCDSCGLALARIVEHSTAATQIEQATALVHCERCGHEQATGKFCDACGLRIDTYQPPVLKHDPTDGPRLCPTCGVPVVGSVCRDCGIRVPLSDETEES